MGRKMPPHPEYGRAVTITDPQAMRVRVLSVARCAHSWVDASASHRLPYEAVGI